MEFAKWYLVAQRGLRRKRKYLPLKIGKKLSEKLLCVLLILLTEILFPFKKPFAKTVPVEFAKWYLEADRGLWCKRKHPKIKTEKKLSGKLLCVLLIHFTELQLSPQEAFCKGYSCGICKVVFGSPSRARVKKEISSVKNWKGSFWETALCYVYSSHRVTAFPSRSLSLRLFLWNLECDIWKPAEGFGEKRNIFR